MIWPNHGLEWLDARLDRNCRRRRMLFHRLGFSSSPEWLERSSRAWRVLSDPSPAPAPASDKDHWRGEHDTPPGQQPNHLRRCNRGAHHRGPQNDRPRGSVGGYSLESIATTYSRSRRVLAPRPDLARRRCWVCTEPIQAVTRSSQTGPVPSSGLLTSSPRSTRRGLARRRARVGARVAPCMASAGRSTSVLLVSSRLDMDVALAAGLLSKYCPERRASR